ncbi:MULTISPECIES: S1 family peptidase [Cellulosimicrobium]|uniref:S1 family peptidase n=1 Tax=Cellulosimicrobium sp. ES-005 TaxID=3163031 RepID=A0AAU8FUQ2_9MICO|nr:S1 family peptidase [Cellulosimicrobium cellulans]MCO7273315.1 S1 family peptidase [Cellulosimicrobium cellulans]
MRRRLCVTLATICALALGLGTATALGQDVGAASGSTVTTAAGVTATPAGGYVFRPGDPMIFSNGGTASGGYEGACTGGYAVAGDSGTFLLGPRACSVIFSSVRGSDRLYGWTFSQNYPDGNALVREVPGDDAYQIVRDPLTGRTPGDGRVVGWTASAAQTRGMLVGKMGIGTGWTEGRITGAVMFRGMTLLCTDMRTDLGDAGAPVWRSDATGLRALGTIQAYDPSTRTGCYRPIQETLAIYGAHLPAFGPSQGRPGFGTLAPGMPWLGGGDALAVPVKNIPVGTDWRAPVAPLGS